MNSTLQQGAWSGKTVMVTGVCGSVGRELLANLCRLDVGAIRGIDTNESELFFLQEELHSDPRVELSLCDIRMGEVLSRNMYGVEIILHAAAYKHVEICERFPSEAIFTNVVGTQNVIRAAFENAVERVILTSSDKAVNPTSVMGTSKLLAERLMTAASAQSGRHKPLFSSIRFGNVVGSRGSVIPLFKSQIDAGGPVTLTDRGMTRFVMSIEEAAKLVMDAVFLARGGEVIVTKMPALRVEDLAEVMIEQLSDHARRRHIKIEVIGSKPGEKMHEELTNEEEVRRTFSWGNYLVIKPALYQNGHDSFTDWAKEGELLDRPYNSATADKMSNGEIKRFLIAAHVLD